MKFRSLYICDDVRYELGGKFSAMGLFPPAIAVGGFPARLRAALLLEVTYEQAGEQTYQVRGIVEETDEPLFEFDVQTNSKVKGQTDFQPLEGLELTFDEKSTLVIQAKSDGGRWRKLRTLSVSVGPWMASPSEPPQLETQSHGDAPD